MSIPAGFCARTSPGRTFHLSDACLKRAPRPLDLTGPLDVLARAGRGVLLGENADALPWPCVFCALQDTLLHLHQVSVGTARIVLVPWTVTEDTEEWQLEPARLQARDDALDALASISLDPPLRVSASTGEALVARVGIDALALAGAYWRLVLLDDTLPAPTSEILEVFAALDAAEPPDATLSPLERRREDRERYQAAVDALAQIS